MSCEYYDINKACYIYHTKNNDAPYVIILIHGGSWISGSAWQIADTAIALHTRLQTSIIVPEYSLSHIQVLNTILLCCAIICIPRAWVISASILLFLMITTASDTNIYHPSHVLDIATCIRWTSDRFEKKKIILIGHSAGAHLASLVMLNERYCPRDVDVIGVICISGVYSHARLQENPIVYMLVHQFIFPHINTLQSFDYWPISQIEYGTTYMPFMIISSKFDFDLLSHAHDLYYALRDVGVPVVYRHYYLDHFSIRKHWLTTNSIVLDDIQHFIRNTL